MTHPTETPVTKKAIFSKEHILSLPWRALLLCVIILASAIFFLHWRQSSSTAAQEVVTNAALPDTTSLPVSAPIPLKPIVNLGITPSIWPARGIISSGFGLRHSPFNEGSEFHPGIDIAYTMGAPVVATADGQVTVSGPAGGYGNLVEIDHGNGITTLYGHNSQLAVHVEQFVKKGQIIAYAGSTGISTGPHVHYEIRVNNTPINPMKYLLLY